MSTRESETEKEYARQLIMKAIDGELRDEEHAILQQQLEKFRELRNELKEFILIKEITMNVKYNPPPEQVWESYWLKVYNRLERNLGWILFSIGAIVLLCYGALSWVQSILVDVD